MKNISIKEEDIIYNFSMDDEIDNVYFTTNIKCIENNINTLNLALPYYFNSFFSFEKGILLTPKLAKGKSIQILVMTGAKEQDLSKPKFDFLKNSIKELLIEAIRLLDFPRVQ